MIKKQYKIVCDNCGKVIATTAVLPNKVDEFAKVGVYKHGKDGHFCNKECYKDWRLHVHKPIL